MDIQHAARTVAESVFVTAAADPERVALRYKVDGQWRDEPFEVLAETVLRLAAGLAVSGIRPGDRVCVLADTRPEWTYASLAVLAAGAVVVPIYPSSSVEDCAWVIGNSGASLVICDSEAQYDKARAAGATEVVTIEAFDGSPRTLDALGRSIVDGWRPVPREPEDLAVIIYTSGTTGPPKGCMLTHRNWLTLLEVNAELSYVTRDDVVYLFLPLAHVFAQMLQFCCVASGATLVYFGGDIKRVVAELAEVRPTFLPSVPRIFEKLYTALAGAPPEVVRGAFGGRLRQALSGAAPIAPEILQFFHTAGVPVLEGYGMTETTGLGTVSTLSRFRIGTVGRAGPWVELRIASDGEILMRGPHLFAGYWRDEEATASTVDSEGWLHTGDLGTKDRDGFVTITGRKKDIIITAGGKNIAPANLENELCRSRWISYAVMYGDRRPFPVAVITLDADEIVPWARERGLPEDLGELAAHPEVRALVQEAVDEVNERQASVAQIKRFAILGRDLSIESGELTPSLKVKRTVVGANHANVIDELYA